LIVLRGAVLARYREPLVPIVFVTDFDAARELSFDGPVHPFDPVLDWREADRRRRGITT
jgi:hypothetical protein